MPELLTWHRQPEESEREYELFEIYMNLNLRSYVKAADQAEVTKQYASRVAKEHNWRERCIDYDVWMGEKKAMEVVKRFAGNMADQATVASELTLTASGIVAKALKSTRVDELGNLEGLTIGQVIKVMETSQKMYRDIAGSTLAGVGRERGDTGSDGADELEAAVGAAETEE